MTKISKKTATKKSTKKADTAPITPKQAKEIVAEYADMRGISVEEAQCALIACGWRRIRALSNHYKKAGAK